MSGGGLAAQVTRMEADLAVLKASLAAKQVKQQQQQQQRAAAAAMTAGGDPGEAAIAAGQAPSASAALTSSAAPASKSARGGGSGIGPKQGCPLLNELAVPPESESLSDIAGWQPAPREPWANSSHFFMYVPELQTEADQHALRRVIRANQFPSDPAACNRTLILSDDALTAGLGYSARLIALALLVAVQEKRVLVMPEHHTRRWCGRPPYTLGCYYEPITHCPHPRLGPNNTYEGPSGLTIAMPKWSTRGSSQGLAHRQSAATPAHVRIGTSQVHKSTFWYKFHPPIALFAATHDLLFRPRAWVLRAARCVMGSAGLHGANYLVVHARFSVEKKKERGASLPPLKEYLPLSEAVLRRANATRIFLQTSTPLAVDLFEQWSKERSWHLSYTENPRAANDLWVVGSGRHGNHSGERTSVVAQTVNAFIAARSRHFISPASSMWTWFVRALMGRRVGDVFHDSGGENFEACVAAAEAKHEEAEGTAGVSNATLAERKRCKRSIPKLIDMHRTPKDAKERGLRSPHDVSGPLMT